MSYELSHDPDTNYVHLRVRGTVTIGLIRELAPKVASMLEKENCDLLLNDMSEATIDISVAGLFSSPDIMDESGVMRSARRALVVPPSFQESVFLENVSRNRGHDLMIFDDVEEAKNWLLAR